MLENWYIIVRFLGVFGCEFFEFGFGFVGFVSWRVFEVECLVVVCGFGFMVDSLFYWIVVCDDNGVDYDLFVVCLDIKEEKFGVVF